jgi:CheY-specific phosphatase CheX
MDNSYQAELFKVGAMTFEELGFLIPAVDLEPACGDAQNMAVASVQFWGPFQGQLTVKISRDMLPVLTTNMLGEEEIPSEQHQLDALGEVANVVCGNVLPLIGGVKEVFHIGAPRAHKNAPAEVKTEDTSVGVRLNFDEGCAELLLSLGSGMNS